MRVLLTGAAGRIGTALRERLPAHGWEVRGFDRAPVPGDGDNVVGELSDLDALLGACQDVDGVVHLAGQPTEAPWPVIRDLNIDGTYTTFEAARRAGVGRLVFASSNHAAGFEPVRPGLPAAGRPRPDTLYGASKAFGEALGHLYADRYGMRVACLRIGTFSERPPDRRSLATWLSPGDCAHLVDACLRSPDLSYQVLWGVSANTRRLWGDDGADVVGYAPSDDAELYAADFAGTPPAAWEDYVGGRFTTDAFGIDEIAGAPPDPPDEL